MTLKIALAGLLVAGFALPAVAQVTTSSTSYYVVQNVQTKKCQVMDVRPTATETTVIGGDGVVYKTRTEAESAMGTATVCTTQ